MQWPRSSKLRNVLSLQQLTSWLQCGFLLIQQVLGKHRVLNYSLNCNPCTISFWFPSHGGSKFVERFDDLEKKKEIYQHLQIISSALATTKPSNFWLMLELTTNILFSLHFAICLQQSTPCVTQYLKRLLSTKSLHKQRDVFS